MKKRGEPIPSEQPEAAFDRTPLLAAVMRHELFGSLNSMTMVAGLLSERARKGSLETEELARLAGRLVKQVERATHIVDHYLDFVGIAGDEEAETHASAREVARVLAEAGIADVDFDQSATLDIDAQRLRFALECVLAFASEQGSVPNVRVEVEGDDFVIDIEHAGGAISVDELHVFEHGPRRISPRLVDLAVARRILTDAGGEMAPHEGGFHLRVPLRED